MAAWFTSMNALYAEYTRRLQNIDAAWKLGLYDSIEDYDAHLMRNADWYLEMSAIMQPVRAA